MTLSKDSILKKIKKKTGRPMKVSELARALGISEVQRRDFRNKIKLLAEEGTLVRLRGGRYGLPDEMNLVTGIFYGHPNGYGFLTPDTNEEGGDMSLVSTTTAAQAAPTKGDIVLTYTNGAGTTTLDTDLTAEISADGGSTWTALALGSEGSTGSHNIATAHDVTISSTITAPWNMAYRIKTLNQSVSKTTRIQAVSLGWS